MNQIITQHGWGLDKSIWRELKIKMIDNNWFWQDNDRGYFSKLTENSQWKNTNKDESIKLVISHSLGTQLIEPDTIYKASHLVIINSFQNFIPSNSQRNKTIRTLKRMEKKLEKLEFDSVLREFIYRAYLPNSIDKNFQTFLDNKLTKVNASLLQRDFKKLFIEEKPNKLISSSCNVLILKSKNDLILEENSCDNFSKFLNQSQRIKPKLIELKNQGHILHNLDIFKLISQWLYF